MLGEVNVSAAGFLCVSGGAHTDFRLWYIHQAAFLDDETSAGFNGDPSPCGLEDCKPVTRSPRLILQFVFFNILPPAIT